MQIHIDIDGKPRFEFTQYLAQQTAQSEINNHLSLTSLLHVLIPTRSSSEKCICKCIQVQKILSTFARAKSKHNIVNENC